MSLLSSLNVFQQYKGLRFELPPNVYRQVMPFYRQGMPSWQDGYEIRECWMVKSPEREDVSAWIAENYWDMHRKMQIIIIIV